MTPKLAITNRPIPDVKTKLNLSAVLPSQDFGSMPPYTPPPASNLPALFNPLQPLQSFVYTDFETPEEVHNKLDAAMTNTAVAALAAVWSQPNLTIRTVMGLIKETREMVKHRRRMYNLSYGADDNLKGPKRARTILLD